MKKRSVKDTIVIYWSNSDGLWVAHSTAMDQLGYGDRIVDALADVITAVHQVLAEAAKDPTLAVLRPAPARVQRMIETANQLPREIFEVACKMATGNWPKEIPFSPDPKRTVRFAATVREKADRLEMVGA